MLLVFPTDFLRLDEPVGTAKKPLLILECARPGKALEVGYFFTREPKAIVEPRLLAIGKPILVSDLNNGEAVWMVAREAEFDVACLSSREQLTRSSGHVDPDAFPVPGVPRTNLNAIFWNAPKDGGPLRMIEIGGVTATRNQ